MGAKWNFPLYNYGRRQGISDSGVETFRGDRYKHLAKEICQNSLDAAKDKNQIVKVEFEKLYIKEEDIPGYIRYIEVFEQCYKTSRDGSGKVKNFFNYTREVLNKKTIPVLRISDFNTIGLVGSKEERDTPWNDLIKAVGISNKEGEAGGSFGIGKYAAFACSNLRTIFYSTYDIDGINAYQGVVEVINFEDVDGKEKDGEGYFGIGNKNEPIFERLVLDKNFNRNDSTGTDIYVIAFIEQEDWVESITYAVVDSFLIAIYNGKLEVKIGDVLINKDTLENIIENKIDYNKLGISKSPLDFYRVLTSEETVVKSFSLHEHKGDYLGEFKLYLLIDNDLTTRRVLMARVNGMKVFEQGRFPRGIPFSGICILQDKGINNYFRQMETPEHDAWKADQYSEDPKEIKKANETRLTLIRTIKDELNEMAAETTLDETDVEDLGMLLPDLEDDFLGSKGNKESLADEEKESKINIQIEDPNKEDKSPIYTEELGEGQGKTAGGRGKGDNPDIIPGEGNGTSRQRIVTNSFNIRLFKKDLEKYRLILNSLTEVENGEILLSAVGEDSRTRENIPVIKAMDGLNKEELSIDGKRIKIGDLAKGNKLIIDFQPNIIEQLSMEVVVYAD